MATERGWFAHNIRARLTNPLAEMEATVAPHPFARLPFDAAADHTAAKLSQCGPLFLALSGGADSDYVLHVFARRQLPITPIIVLTGGNAQEAAYGFASCERLGIAPVVLRMREAEVLKSYYDDIFTRLNGYGVHSVAALRAGRYAQEHGGHLVIGEHCIDGDDDAKKRVCAVNEWDFYNEALIEGAETYPFFLYTPELAYAMVARIRQGPVAAWKAGLYGLTPRPKLHYAYSALFNQTLVAINKKRAHYAVALCRLGTRERFLAQLDPFIT